MQEVGPLQFTITKQSVSERKNEQATMYMYKHN